MQFERVGVLRFTVGASILFVLSMLAFGRLILETRARSQETEAIRQHEMAERDRARLHEEQVRTRTADLDARIDELFKSLQQLEAQIGARRGCQAGNAARYKRVLGGLQEARAARDAAQIEIEVLRCRQQPGCSVLH